MHIKFTKIAIFTLVSLFSSVAFANPGRMTVWAHGGYELSETTSVKSDFAYAGLQSAHPTGYAYVGPEFNLAKWLSVDVFGGFMTGDQGIISPRAIMVFGKFSTWTLAELYSKEYGSYVFQMVNYQPAKWLKTGAEYESFGSWAHPAKMSHGVGPVTTLILSDHFAVNLVLQARRNGPGDWQPEPQVRFHFSL